MREEGGMILNTIRSKGVKERAMRKSGEKPFWVEKTAGAKALRQG